MFEIRLVKMYEFKVLNWILIKKKIWDWNFENFQRQRLKTAFKKIVLLELMI